MPAVHPQLPPHIEPPRDEPPVVPEDDVYFPDNRFLGDNIRLYVLGPLYVVTKAHPFRARAFWSKTQALVFAQRMRADEVEATFLETLTTC